MVSTPSSLLTNLVDGASATGGPQRPIATRGYSSPTKASYETSTGLALNLMKVIGTTSSSVSGFDCITEKSCFATCAGSVASLHRIDEKLVVTSKYFRAKPNALAAPAPIDSTQPNTPDWRGRQYSSIRASTFGAKGSASPVAELANSPGKGAAKQRTRAATCLSLSQDGKLLAVGETGHVPRILLFSTEAEDNQAPYSSLSEHTFGVRCLSFSPDSRWLCSVGDIHDGYIFLWAINPRNGMPKLQASNKCTSFVHDLAWMGSSLVSVGTRHVKIWRTESLGPVSPSKSKFRNDLADSTPSSPSGSKTFPGRNCLLGASLQSTFTCVAALSGCRAVVCSDKGDVCVLDDSSSSVSFHRVRSLGFAITCVSIDKAKDEIWIGGQNEELRRFSISEIDTNIPPASTESSKDPPSVANSDDILSGRPSVLALGHVGDRLVSIDTNHHINIFDNLQDASSLPQSTFKERLRSHSSAALGVLKIDASSIASYDAMGIVIFWTLEGDYLEHTVVSLDQTLDGDEGGANELKVLTSSYEGKFCAAGDRYGFVHILEGKDWKDEKLTLKAHGGDINDISLATTDDQTRILATCGRDRTIQLFQKTLDGLDLLQTIEQHASSVNSLLFCREGQILCSASSDRTIVVHSLAINNEMKAFLPTRILTTKQSPMSMALWPGDPNHLVVTTMDKQLHRFDTGAGLCVSSTKLSDDSSGAVALACISTQAIANSSLNLNVVFGVSPTDKSVRVHDLQSGSLIAKDYGHSEGLTNATIIDECNDETGVRIKIASTGLDGSLMIWELTSSPFSSQQADPSTPVGLDTPVSQQPLRRVLSRTAIAEFSKTLEASGMSPLPPTPSRNPSPSRGLRKKPSKYSLSGIASAKISSPPPLRRPNRSPSPPTSPASSISYGSHRRPMLRVKSVGNFNDCSYAADQLVKSMRTFRKKMLNSSDSLRSETVKELEKELSLTAKAIGQSARRRQSASEMNVGDLLDEYSDKLAQMVQEKVNLGIEQQIERRNNSSGASSENTDPRNKS